MSHFAETDSSIFSILISNEINDFEQVHLSDPQSRLETPALQQACTERSENVIGVVEDHVMLHTHVTSLSSRMFHLVH